MIEAECPICNHGGHVCRGCGTPTSHWSSTCNPCLFGPRGNENAKSASPVVGAPDREDKDG